MLQETHRRKADENIDGRHKSHYFWDPYQAGFMLSEPAYSVDKYARIYFPVTYIVLNAIYWIVYGTDEIVF